MFPIHSTLDSSLGAHAWTPCTREVEAGGSGRQGNCCLFETNLSCMRPCLKKGRKGWKERKGGGGRGGGVEGRKGWDEENTCPYSNLACLVQSPKAGSVCSWPPTPSMLGPPVTQRSRSEQTHPEGDRVHLPASPQTCLWHALCHPVQASAWIFSPHKPNAGARQGLLSSPSLCSSFLC